MMSSPAGEETRSDLLLADDLLAAVFAYLDWKDAIRAQVCRRWREAAARAVVPSSSILPLVLGYLDWRDALRARGTCAQWREAAARTPVLPQFHVNSSRAYKTLDALRKALPNLQQICLSKFREDEEVGEFEESEDESYEETEERYYMEGEEPDLQSLEYTKDFPAYDVSIVADFKNLRSLVLKGAPLNGKYPCLFGFKNLRELSICNRRDDCNLTWDLNMLSSMPLLEKLKASWGGVTGSLSDLHFLKETLRELIIDRGSLSARSIDTKIEGDFMDLADFGRLEKLDLKWAAGVGGDVGKIKVTDFPRLRELDLPGVLQSIQQSLEVIRVFADLSKRTPQPCISSVRLSEHSPDYYRRGDCCPSPAFTLEFVKAGSRSGWRWTSETRWQSVQSHEIRWQQQQSLEINWLNSEPDELVYQEKAEEMARTVRFYKGMYTPPSKRKYLKMCRKERRRRQQEFRSMMARLASLPSIRNAGPAPRLDGH